MAYDRSEIRIASFRFRKETVDYAVCQTRLTPSFLFYIRIRFHTVDVKSNEMKKHLIKYCVVRTGYILQSIL